MTDVLNSVFANLGKHFSVGRGGPPGLGAGTARPPPLPHDTSTSAASPVLSQALAAQQPGGMMSPASNRST